MNLINTKKTIVESVLYSKKVCTQSKITNNVPLERFMNYSISDFKAGVAFAEKEYQSILLELIESIFNYEKESGSKIIEFDRTPETILEQFIITKKSNEE